MGCPRGCGVWELEPGTGCPARRGWRGGRGQRRVLRSRDHGRALGARPCVPGWEPVSCPRSLASPQCISPRSPAEMKLLISTEQHLSRAARVREALPAQMAQPALGSASPCTGQDCWPVTCQPPAGPGNSGQRVSGVRLPAGRWGVGQRSPQLPHEVLSPQQSPTALGLSTQACFFTDSSWSCVSRPGAEEGAVAFCLISQQNVCGPGLCHPS